jgi:2,4-dichlorophenol 6-monooxygenase
MFKEQGNFMESLDLLIVGAGPAGLLASSIASTIGLTHQVIEQRTGLHTEPSAHVLKTHTMEVYGRIGAAEEIFQLCTPPELQTCIAWCESIGGLTYGRLDLTGRRGKVSRFMNISTAHSANLPQNIVEPILHARAKALAGHDPVSFATPFSDFSQDDDGVTVTIGIGAEARQVRTRYLIGADGAASAVRRSAGLRMEGPQALAHFLAIHIKSDMMPFLARNPALIFFIRSAAHEGFFIVHQPVGSQVFMMRYDPEATPYESFDEAKCQSIMKEVFGCPHDFSIAAIDRWAMSAQVASGYRNDRVFLIGDAGHRFPPTGGLGLNTGVEDVENLIWKLGAVLRGEAGEALLDSYELECRPTAVRNTNQSVSNHSRMSEVDTVLGSNGDKADFQASIDALKANPDHPRFAQIQTAINDQMPHFSFLELEVAASPKTGAFLPANRPIEHPVPPNEGYQPSLQPGGHIPHFWIAPDRASINVLSFDRLTLFAPSSELLLWQTAVDALPDNRMGVNIVPVDPGMHSPIASMGDFWGGDPFAFLVRPDGRIAWVEPMHVSDRSVALADAIDQVTGWKVSETVS